MAGSDLWLGGLFAFLFAGIGFDGSPLAESSWLANPLFLLGLVFFVTKKFLSATKLAACAAIAALLMFVPGASHGTEGQTAFGPLEIGY